MRTREIIIAELEQIERDYKNQSCNFDQYGNSTADTSDLEEKESLLLAELQQYPL